MDEVRGFFTNPRPSQSQMTRLRGPVTGGMRLTRNDETSDMNRREEHRHSVLVASGTEYALEIKKRETELYLRNEKYRESNDGMSGGLDSLEQLSSFGASTQNIRELTEEAMTEVYNKYSFQKKEDTKNLSINRYKQEILDRIRGCPIVIVEGPTGCGKTTQVPQWILDDCYQARRTCKIVVTQPRRIAAISIARRVAQERGWEVGGVVGYQVGLDAHTSADTRISYVTTGILLQKLVNSKTMNEYTHVILDEVHERGQDMDFLLLIVKRLLYTVSPGVKVVLMSATFDRKAFADYFMMPTPRGAQMSSCIKVDNNNPMFPMKVFYLNDLKKFGEILNQTTRSTDEFLVPEMHHLVIKLLNAFEQIDKQEDNVTDRSEADLPSVLIFLPGIHEIEDLYACLTDNTLRAKVAGPECPTYKWYVLPLHSTITSDEQARVFQRVAPGTRKIILATNIAESSITVPDIKYVIDYCLMKVMVADADTSFSSLRLSWASKTNCEQRAGRCGRVREGRVYRLVTNKFYDNLQEECVPEIIRCPLDRLVLLTKLLEMGPPCEVLALAMDPPDITNIQRTILVLKEMGALKKTVDGEWDLMDGDITYLGRVAARLPINPKLAKLIMLGYIYGCLEEAVIMASAMSVKNLFSSPFRERLNAYNSKLTWADGSTSDCIAFLNVYKVWSHLHQQQYFRAAGHTEAQWARRFYVQARAMRELDELVRDIRKRLAQLGIDPPNGKSPWNKHELALLYKIIIAGAFYPQYFSQVSGDEDQEREAVRTLGGRDPRNTVYLKNLPDGQPGEVYAAAIKKAVVKHISDEPRITFDANTRKVFLTFDDGLDTKGGKQGDPTIPGQVLLPVYKAVKARQLGMDIRIPILPLPKALELFEAFAIDKMSLDLEKVVPRLPEIDDTHFPLKISQFNNVNKFWVQYGDRSTEADLRAVQAALNQAPLIAHTGTLACGALLAAPYAELGRTEICRVRVLQLLPRDMVEVLYIDYGSKGHVHSCNLRSLPGGQCRSCPPLGMQCRLAALAASPLLDPHCNFTPAAMQCFKELACRGRLLGKVYSVVQGVVAIDLLAEGGQLNVNTELIRRGFAVPCEESYDSKLNHDIREKATDLNLVQKRAYNREQLENAYFRLAEIEPPSAKECDSDVCLNGPHSPLETAVHSMMFGSREKQVVIEWNSVNSVLLDTDPQDKTERMLVSADVGCNEGMTRLTLRHTTLMPNIPGLPAILALLFCPLAELRRNAAGTRYASALCGLGSAESGQPYLPEHDMLVNIDADFNIEDIGLINHIRHLMDMMMYCPDGHDQPTADDELRPQIPRLIRTDLMDLLKKRRTHRTREYVKRAWTWRSVPEHELLEISLAGSAERAVMYPLHAPQELYPVCRDALIELKRGNDQLKLLVSRTPVSSSAELACKLCGTEPMRLQAMRIHLYSNGHREKEEDFRSLES